MTLSTLFLLFSLFSLSFSLENLDTHLTPRPLIVEYTDNLETHLQELKEELVLQCTSWRFSVEANNLSPWKTIPDECRDYVKDYMTNRGYRIDLERVSKEAGDFAKSVEFAGDGMEAWIFDVDETLLSNLPYYADHSYGYVSLFVFCENLIESERFVFVREWF